MLQTKRTICPQAPISRVPNILNDPPAPYSCQDSGLTSVQKIVVNTEIYYSLPRLHRRSRGMDEGRQCVEVQNIAAGGKWPFSPGIILVFTLSPGPTDPQSQVDRHGE